MVRAAQGGSAGFGSYATTPVVVNGVVYMQDLWSNVMAIGLATGKVLWMHTYDSRNGGPDSVNVAGGVVYAATATPRSPWMPRRGSSCGAER